MASFPCNPETATLVSGPGWAVVETPTSVVLFILVPVSLKSSEFICSWVFGWFGLVSPNQSSGPANGWASSPNCFANE